MASPNVTIVRTGQSYPTIGAAVAASQAGDVLNVQGGTGQDAVVYAEAEMTIDWDLTIQVVGDPKSVKSYPFDPVNNVYRTIGKGLFTIGQAGTYPTVIIDGLHITECSAALNKGTTVLGTKWGLNIQPGQPNQTSDGNSAGIRYQSGNLTVRNSLIDYCQNGLLVEPFVDGEGTFTWENSEAAWCGTGIGQQHNAYIGPIAEFTMTNVNSHHSIAGQAIKIRAIKFTLDGNTLGTIDAADETNCEGQTPDGGGGSITNCALARGTGAQNPYPIEIGGVFPRFYDSPDVTIGNITLNDQSGGKTVAVVWNFMADPVTIDGLAITTNDPTPPAILTGLGSWKNVTVNGAAIPDGSCNYQALVPLVSAIITDLGATTDPQSVVIGKYQAVFGGAGLLTVTAPAQVTESQVISGPGGANINVPGGISFADHPDDAPSTVYISSPQFIFCNSKHGGTFTVDQNSGSKVMLSGQGTVLNTYNVTAGSPGAVAMKQAYPGQIPSATIVQRGSKGEMFQIRNGGTMTITGTTQAAQYEGFSAPGNESPAVYVINNTWNGVAFTGRFSGGGFDITQQQASGVAQVISYTDPNTTNIFEPGIGPWNLGLLNDVVDFGASTQATATTANATYLEDIAFAAVAGSGSGALNVENIPGGLIQIIGGHNDGGTLTVGNYNKAHAAAVPVALLDVIAAAPVQSGTTYTTLLSNGTTLIAQGSPPNLTVLAGASDTTITAPLVSGPIGAALPLGLGITDAYAAKTVGFVKAKITNVSGCTVNFAAGGTFVGTFADLLAANAACSVTPTGPAASFAYTFFNQAGVATSVTVSVAGVGLELNAPASIELNSGTVCPIPGLSVTDSLAPSGSVTVGFTSAGTVTPASTAGSVAAVNVALAGAQYQAGLVAGTDTIHVSAVDTNGQTAAADIAVKVDWSPAWNDIALSVPGPQTIAAGGTLSLAGVTIADPLATQAGVPDTLLVTNSTGTLLAQTGSPAALQAAVQALGVSEPTAGTDAIVVQVGNPAGFTASGTVGVTVNAGVVNWPAAGGTFAETSNGTTYNCTGTAGVTATITGTGNTLVAGAAGSIDLTDNTGGNTLSPPEQGRGNITIENGTIWATEKFDLRELLTSAGFVPGNDPKEFLQVTMGGQTAALSVRQWAMKMTFKNSGTITLDQILAQAIIPT